MIEAEVAIVGGGLLGACFGWGLTRQGVSTVMLDQGDTAVRTARGNFGLVWLQGKGVGMPAYSRWTLESIRSWDDFAAELQAQTDIDVCYRRPGGFHLCTSEQALAGKRDMMTTLSRQLGPDHYDYEIVDQARLRQAIPAVGDIPGALFTPHDGHCNPLRLLRALHAGFASNGGSYLPHSQVERIARAGDGRYETYNEHGSLLSVSDKIVIAAGHGSAGLGAQLGLDIPIFPDQGQVLVTEKTAPLLNFPTTTIRQTNEGNLMLGLSSQEVGMDTRTDPATIRAIVRDCMKAMPVLKSLRIQRIWAALRIMTPDGFPIYQHSDSHPGAFSFTCHSGVTLAAVHALTVAPWIQQGRIPADRSCFHPARLQEQPTCSNG